MADGEVRAQDLAQETAGTLSGNEQFVMFDSTAGKRADIDDVATYIAGDKTTLKTTNKTSPVAAINENFDAIADVKEDFNLELYGLANAIDNCYLAADGSFVSDNDYMVSDKIPVTNATITWNYGSDMSTNAKLVAFKSTDVKDDYFSPQGGTGRTVSISANASYIRISIKKANAKVTQVLNGLTVLYENPRLVDGVGVKVDDVAQELDTFHNVQNATYGYYLNSSGEFVADNDYCVSDFIEFDRTKSLVWHYGVGLDTKAKLIVYNESKAKVNDFSPFAGTEQRAFNGYDITPNAAKFVRVSFLIENAKVSYVKNDDAIIYDNPSNQPDGLITDVDNVKRTPITLKVLAYNVQSFKGKGQGAEAEFPNGPTTEAEYNETMQRFVGVLNKYNPDILIVSEDLTTFPYNSTDVYSVLWSHHYPYRTYGRNNVACAIIYSKYKILDYDLIKPDYGAEVVQDYRYIIWAKISVLGTEVDVIGMLPNGGANNYSSDRLPYFNKTIEILSDKKYGLAAGDFNTESNDPSSELAPFRTAGYQIANIDWFGTFDTYPVPNPNNPNDNCVCKNMTIGHMEIGDEEYSDHLPIFTVLNIR